MTQAVLSCRDPRVAGAWQGFADAAELYARRVTEIVTAAAGGTGFTAVWEPCAGVPGRFTGITAIQPDAAPPPGWHAEGPVLVPDPDRAAGRWATAALAAAGHPGDPQAILPGLPAGATRVPGFTVTVDGDGLIVSWDRSGGAAGPADPAIWEPVYVRAGGHAEHAPAGGDRP